MNFSPLMTISSAIGLHFLNFEKSLILIIFFRFLTKLQKENVKDKGERNVMFILY